MKNATIYTGLISLGTIKDNLQSREMQLFDMFGEPPQFTSHEMKLVLRNGIFLKYAAAVVFLLTAFDTHGYREAGMPLFANVMLWAVCVAGFILVYVGMLLAWFVLAPGGPVVRMLRAVPNATAMVLVSVLVVAVASSYTDMEFNRQALLQHLPYNIVLSYAFETLLFVFVLPHVDASLKLGLYRRGSGRSGLPLQAEETAAQIKQADSGPAADAEPEAPSDAAASRPVVLSGKTFALEELRYAKSEEHYLRIATRSGQQTLRGRLGDLIAQMPEGAGIQPHRSWWVARTAVAGLKRGSQGDVLLLEEGIRVPVARGRRAQVREIARHWQIEEH